jgi:DNA-binding FadR family transcriptional regulator
MSIFDYLVDRQLRNQFNRIEQKIDALTKQGAKTMAAIDDLEVQVTAISDAEAAAVALLNGLHQQLADAIASGDPVRVQAAADQLKAKAADLAAAVVANT